MSEWKEWLSNQIRNKTGFMSFVGIILVFHFALMSSMQLIEYNLLLKNTKVTIEVYERLVDHIYQRNFEFVNVIILFYFSRNQRNTHDDKELKDDIH